MAPPKGAPLKQPKSFACQTPVSGAPGWMYSKRAKWWVPGLSENSNFETAKSVGFGTGTQRQPSCSSPGWSVGPSRTSW